MKKNYIFLTIITVAISFAFTSCKKNEDLTNDGKNVLKNSQVTMRYFADFNELTEEVKKTLGFDYNELIVYEKSIGFNSFGKLAEEAMMPILTDVENNLISNIQIAKRRIAANSDFIQLISEDNEEFCETRYFKSPYRYVMNIDRMFKVDTLYFKVFEGGHVGCDIDYYNQLLNMSEADFDMLQDNPIFYVFRYSDGAKSYSLPKETYAVNGTERVHVKLSYGEGMRRMVNGCVRIETGYLQAKTWGTHKWAGIWWSSNRTHSQNINACLNVGSNCYCGSTSGTKSGYKIEGCVLTFTTTFPYGVSNPAINLVSATGWGKVPAVTCYINW